MPETKDLGPFSNVGFWINACVKISETVKDPSCLPPSIKDLQPRLLRIQRNIVSASKSIDAYPLLTVSRDTLMNELKECGERAAQLHEILKDMILPAEISNTKKVLKKMRTASKESRVNRLIGEIMEILQSILENEAFKADKKADAEEQAEDSKTMDQQGQEKDNGEANGFPNKKLKFGTQYNYHGAGNQNVAMEKAAQINGAVAGGEFNFKF